MADRLNYFPGLLKEVPDLKLGVGTTIRRDPIIRLNLIPDVPIYIPITEIKQLPTVLFRLKG